MENIQGRPAMAKRGRFEVPCSNCAQIIPYSPEDSMCSHCHLQTGTPFAWQQRPSTQVPCSNCAQLIPYSAEDRMCPRCHLQTGTPFPWQQQSSFQMAQPTVPVASYFHTPMLPPSNSLKRMADSALPYSGPSKRSSTNAYGSSSNPLMRRTVVGPAAQDYKRSAALTDDDEDDEEFEDAQEELPSTKVDQGFSGIIGEVEEDEDQQETAVKPSARRGDEALASRGNPESAELSDLLSDDDGLFSMTFGQADQYAEDEEDGEEDEEKSQSEVEEGGGKANDDSPDDDIDEASRESEENAEEDEMEQQEDESDSKSSIDGKQSPSQAASEKGERVDSADPTTTPSSLTRGPPPPDPDQDCSTNLSNLYKFHLKAKDLIPRLPLAPHRYWIGVLILDVSAKTVSRENQFIWMKGNRVTTVRTVWHTYQNTTATEEFVLLLGMERVEMTDKMCELDYFNEKKIMFRVVREGTREARGRELCEEAVPKSRGTEVIEID